jgi:GTPase
MKTMDDVEKLKDTVGNGQVCPIFSCSSFTGEGIDLIRKFMSILPKSIVRTQNISLTKQKDNQVQE